MTRHLSEPMIGVRQCRQYRDMDRRKYRAGVILVLVLQVVIVLPVRFAIDTMLNHYMLRDFSYLKPFVPIVLLALVIAIWIFGILFIFRREY